MHVVKIVAAFLFCLRIGADCSAATLGTSERSVKNNVLVSTGNPKVTLRLPSAMRYVGTDRWILYGIANCELFAFVDADARKKIRRLYWVQFEGYIPEMPKLQHDYNSARRATLGGLDFYIDTWVEELPTRNQKPADMRPLEDFIRSKGYRVPASIHSGSDQQHIEALIRARGYTIPAGLMSVRLVHVLNGRRKELMIIYSEDVATTAYAAAALKKTGKNYSRWQSIQKRLIGRAESGIRIRQL